MLKEEFLQQLLATLYENESINVYDHIANQYSIQSEEFANTKPLADQLVREKLATYSDTEHTILQITNYGRYWIFFCRNCILGIDKPAIIKIIWNGIRECLFFPFVLY